MNVVLQVIIQEYWEYPVVTSWGWQKSEREKMFMVDVNMKILVSRLSQGRLYVSEKHAGIVS